MRKLGLAVAILLVFVVSVAVLLNVMPSPHKTTDYLVVGAVGTLLALLLLFVVLIKTAAKPPSEKPDPEA